MMIEFKPMHFEVGSLDNLVSKLGSPPAEIRLLLLHEGEPGENTGGTAHAVGNSNSLPQTAKQYLSLSY
eukprot:1654154-Rhodomonas_salina.1